jgi:hypothetical protein
VQAHPRAREERGADLEQGPALRRRRLAGHAVPDRGEPCLSCRRGQVRQVFDGDLVAGDVGQDSLLAVGLYHGTQHVVAHDHLVQALAQAPRVEVVTFEFEVEVGAHAAKFHRGVAADPVGVLDVRQREGFVPLARLRNDLSPLVRGAGGLQELDQLIALKPQLLAQLRGQRSGGRQHVDAAAGEP